MTAEQEAAPTETREPEATVAPAEAPRVEAPVDLAATLARMQRAHRAAGAPSYDQRIASLRKLSDALLARKASLADAISRDFGNRSKHESLLAEIFVTVEGISHTRARLREWMEASERDVGWAFIPARAEVRMQPLGVIGIISPWNYPVQLALSPLAGALAAGNRAILKPSELVPETSEALRKLVADTFDPDEVTVVTGGAEVGEAFAKLPFDHLVFTGSTRIGKVVMRAAAENLTPLTLELGGKSPAIVGADASMKKAARAIAQGKLFNAGQTCIAPDYALVPAAKVDAFVSELEAAITDMYPALGTNADYTTIVNDRHYARLAGAIDDAKEKGAKIVSVNPGALPLDPSSRRLAPTLVLQPTEEMVLMQEEIFGPILPIKTYAAFGEAVDYVNDHPRPLALYYFGEDEEERERVLEHTTSGGVSVNATMLHIAQDDLPFGGVGPSGMGHYHAREGFEAFSKKKPVFYQSRINGSALLTPPFGKLVETFLRFVLGK